MKISKLLLWLTIPLFIVIILFLIGIVFVLLLDDITRKRIPDYNYHLTQVIENNREKTIPVTILNESSWDKACFLGPYGGGDSSKVIGFDWDITHYTDVLNSDGYNVLVFVSNDKVNDFVIQSRSRGDFSDLSGTCLERNQQVVITKHKKVLLADKLREK